MGNKNNIDFWGWILSISFLILLTIAGYLAYKSIDYKVLTKLENTPLILPTPILSSANPSTPSDSLSPQPSQ